MPLDIARVEAVFSEVAAALGWSLAHVGPAYEVHEDATRLHCHCAPLRARLTLSPAPPNGSTLRIDGEVPGWGPIASRHVREQTDLLTRRLGLAVARAAQTEPEAIAGSAASNRRTTESAP